MTTKFVAQFAHPSDRTAILAGGETADAAIADAVSFLGSDHIGPEHLVALPVTDRLGAVWDDGREVTRYREIDGVVDIADFRYALFSHREDGGFVNHHGTEAARSGEEAAREILSDLDLPADSEFVVVAIPMQFGFSEVFQQVDAERMLWKPKAGFERAVGMQPVTFDSETS
jgi:hypothetical protein